METRLTGALSEQAAALERAGQFQDLLQLYQSRAAEAVAPQEAVELLAKAAEVAREKLEDAPGAEHLLVLALNFGRHSEVALRELRLLYEKTQQHEALTETVERLARLARGSESAALYLQAAQLYEKTLDRPASAIVCYQLSLRADAKQRTAYQRARALALREGRHAAAFKLLERERAAFGPNGLCDAYLEIAEPCVVDPSQRELALNATEQALALEPENARALKLRSTLTGFEETWGDRLRMLRQEQAQSQDPKAMARASLGIAQLLAGFQPSAKQKIDEAIQDALRDWPAMPEALSLLERLAERDGTYDVWVKRLWDLAQSAPTPAVRAEYLVQAAVGQLQRLQKTDLAIATLQLAVETDPSRADAVSLAVEQLLDQDRIKDAILTLEHHLASLEDPRRRAAIRLQLAELCGRGLGAWDRARGHLQVVLAEDDRNPQVTYRLAEALVQVPDAAALERVIDVAINAPRPVLQRVGLAEAAAKVFASDNRPRSAFDALSRALVLAPERESLLTSAAEHAVACGAEWELSRTLKKSLPSASEHMQLRMWRTVARLLDRVPDASEEAQKAWKEVLARASEDSEAAMALTKQTRSTASPTDRQVYLEQALQALGEPPSDPNRAIELLGELVVLCPNVPALEERRASLLAQKGQWAALAGSLERLVSLTEGNTQAGWKARWAQVLADRLDRADEAAVALLSLVQRSDVPLAVIRLLEQLSSRGVRREDIAHALAPHYTRVGEAQRQVASWVLEVATEPYPLRQRALLEQMAQVQEEVLREPRSALESYLRALAIDPSEPTLLEQVVRLAQELGAHAEARRHLHDLAERSNDPELRAVLWKQAADLAEQGQDAEGAIASLRRMLDTSSADDPSLLERLVGLYTRSLRWSQADLLLRRRILTADDADKGRLYEWLSEVDAQLGRPGDAATALREAFRWGTVPLRHWPRLCQLLEQSGRATELAEVLSQWSEHEQEAGNSAHATELALRRAQVVERLAGSTPDRLEHHAATLARKPYDSEALEALESNLSEPAHRLAAARVLVAAYQATKDHRHLVTALSVVAQQAEDPGERLLALKRMAELYLQHLQQPDMAFAALSRALELAPGDVALLDACQNAAARAEALESFVEVVTDLLTVIPDAFTPLYHRHLAELFEKRLGDRSAAVRHWHAALANTTPDADALRALVRLHRAGEEWAALAETLERLAEHLPDQGERIAAFREAALVQEQQLLDKESAARAWRSIALLDGRDVEAAVALERLCTELARPPELAFALELRRAQETDGLRAKEISLRLARLKWESLLDSAGAISLCADILREDPHHAGAQGLLAHWAGLPQPEGLQAFDALDAVLAAQGEHEKRIAIREGRAEGLAGVEKNRWLSEALALWERELQQPDRAYLLALKALATGATPADRTFWAQDLERLARKTSSQEELSEIFETTAEELPSEEAVSLWRRAALLREELGHLEPAVRLWNRILAAAPQNTEALEHLTPLLERSQSAQGLARLYHRRAELAPTPEESRALRAKLAELLEQAGDDEGAAKTLELLTTEDAKSAHWVALERLYGRLQRPDLQLNALEKLLGSDVPGEPAAVRQLRKAVVLERLDKSAEAFAVYAQVLQTSPQDPVAVAGLERLLLKGVAVLDVANLLEPIYRAHGETRKLMVLLEQKAGALRPAEAVPVFRALAKLLEESAQKPSAFRWRLRLFTETPADEENRARLETMATELGMHDALVSAYEDVLERSLPPDLAHQFQARVADIYGRILRRVDLEVKAREQLVRVAGETPKSLGQLAEAYRRAMAWPQLAKTMLRQAELETSADTQSNLFYEVSHLAEDTLGDLPLAAQALHGLVERFPKDRAAHRALDRVLQMMGRWEEVVPVLHREIALADEVGAVEEALDLRVTLARVRYESLKDPAGALVLYREVLARRRGYLGAVAGLEELARSGSQVRAEAVSALEAAFTDGADPLKLAEVLENRVQAADRPEVRVELLRRLADLQVGALHEPEVAFLTASRALRELPSDAQALSLCLSLGEASQASEELVLLLKDVLPRVAERKARASLLLALARLQEKSADFHEAAVSYRQALQIAPDDTATADALDALYARQNKTRERLDLLKGRLTAVGPGQDRMVLLLRLAKAYEESGDETAALEVLRNASHGKPDVRPLVELERLLRRRGDKEEQADVLSRLARLSDSADARRGYSLQRALALEEAGAHAPAAEAFANLLEVNPQDAEALEGLERLIGTPGGKVRAAKVLEVHYRNNGFDDRRVMALQMLLDASSSTDRPLLLEEMASLRERLGQPALALASRAALLAEAPGLEKNKDALERLAQSTGALDELAAAYEETLERPLEERIALVFWRRLAELYEGPLAAPDKAASALEQVVRCAPADLEALSSLARLYRLKNDGPSLLRALLATSQVVQDEDEAVVLLHEAARCAQSLPGEQAQAAECYRRILTLRPGEPEAAQGLERVLLELGHHQSLAEELSRQLAQAATSNRRQDALELKLKLARLDVEALGEPHRALRRIREVLDVDASHEGALAALNVLVERDTAARAETAEVLEPLLEARGSHERRVEVLELHLSATTDKAKRSALLRRMSDVQSGPLQQPARAYQSAARALSEDPSAFDMLSLSLQRAGSANAEEGLLLLLEDLASQASTSAAKASLHRALATIQSKLSLAGPAMESWRKVRAESPEDVEAYLSLERLYLDSQRFTELAQLYKEELERATADEQRARLLEKRVSALESAGDDAGALESARACYGLAPADSLAWEWQRLAGKLGRFAEQAQVLEKLEATAQGPSKAEVLERKARALESAGVPREAMQAYAAAIDLSPDSVPAMEGLERLTRSSESEGEAAARTLEALYRQTGRSDRLADILTVQLARISGSDRMAKLEELAALREGQGAVGPALESWAEAYRLGSTHPPLLGIVERLAEETGRFDMAAEAMESRLSSADDAGLRRRLARLYEEKLERLDLAARHWEKLAEQAPTDTEPLEVLSRLYPRTGAYAAMRSVLERRIALDPSVEGQVRGYTELAALATGPLNDLQLARECAEQILQRRPEALSAFSAVEDALHKEASWSQMARVLERRVELSRRRQDAADERASLIRLARVQEENLAEGAAAIVSFRRLQALSPGDNWVLARLEHLCHQLSRWPELVEAYEAHLQAPLPESEVEGLRIRLAEVLLQRMAERRAALETLQQVLSANPKQAAARAMLEALVLASPDDALAGGMLAKAYRAAGDEALLTRLLEARAVAAPTAFERARLWMELGAVREASGALELALIAVARALRELPSDAEALTKFEFLADKTGEHEGFVDLLDALWPRLEQDADKVRFGLAAGARVETQAPERAVTWYERARAQAGATSELSGPVLTALERLYTQLQAWPKLVEVLAERRTFEPNAEAQAELAVRQAQLLEQHLENVEGAIALYERALSSVPQHALAEARLEQLYESTGRHEKLLELLGRLSTRVGGEAQDALDVRRGNLLSGPLDRTSAAIELYQSVLHRTPAHSGAFVALSDLYTRHHQTEPLLALLQERLKVASDDTERLALWLRLARLWRENEQTASLALDAYRQARALSPEGVEVLTELSEALEKVCAAPQAAAELAQTLEKLLVLEGEQGKGQARLIRLAQLQASLDKPGPALLTARRAFRVSTEDSEALAQLDALFGALSAPADSARCLEARAEVLVLHRDIPQAVTLLYSAYERWLEAEDRAKAARPLERILALERSPHSKVAFDALRALYSELSDWTGFERVVSSYLPHIESASERFELCAELAQVQEQQLQKRSACLGTWILALRALPNEPRAQQNLQRLARELGAYREVADAMLAVFPNVAHNAQTEPIRLWLADTLDATLDAAKDAQAVLEQILAKDPTHVPSLERLAAMAVRRGDDAEHARVLERWVGVSTDLEVKLSLLGKLAETYEHRLQDPSSAAGALSRRLELRKDRETAQNLATLYRRHNQWTELIHALIVARDLANTAFASALVQVELAQVYEQKLQDDEAALGAYTRALDLDLAAPGALEATERLFKRLGRPGELLAVYRKLLAKAGGDAQRPLLLKTAQLLENDLQDASGADAYYQRMHGLDPKDLEPLKALARLRRSSGRYEALVDTLERHHAVEPDAQIRAELSVELGDVLLQHLQQTDAAISAYERALESDPKRLPALHALGQLYQLKNSWSKAVDVIRREVQCVGTGPGAVELWYHLGHIQAQRLNETTAARDSFGEALRIAPSHGPALRAAKELARQDSDWEGYQSFLMREEAATSDKNEKAALCLEAAQYFAGRREQPEQARIWYEKALAAVPETLEAARPLADLYESRGDWSNAERILDLLTARLGEQVRSLSPELGAAFNRLGRACERLGKLDKALGAYQKAYQHDATSLGALRDLGALAVKLQKHDVGQKAFQAMLIHHRRELTDQDVVETYWQLGDLQRASGQLELAHTQFEMALGIDPRHTRSLKALVEVADSMQRYDRAARYRQALIALVSGDEKKRLCLELAALQRDQLKDPASAIHALSTALSVTPGAKDVLEPLWRLYRDTSQGQRAVGVLEQLLQSAEVRNNRSEKKRVHFIIGEVTRDLMGAVERAVLAFDAALDVDPDDPAPFAAIEDLLSTRKKWSMLEKAYVRMIGRLPSTPNTHTRRMQLWRSLAELYKGPLRKTNDAIAAYEVVASGLPSDPAVQMAYAELSAQKPGGEEAAIEAYRRALRHSTEPGKMCGHIARLAEQLKETDLAFRAARAACVLFGEEDPYLLGLYQSRQAKEEARTLPQRPLSDPLWKKLLLHPRVRSALGEVMAHLHLEAGEVLAEKPSAYDVTPKKHALAPVDYAQGVLARYLAVSKALGTSVELYSPFLASTRDKSVWPFKGGQPDAELFLELCYSQPLLMKAGGMFFQNPPTGTQLDAELAGALAGARPELALVMGLPEGRVEAILQGALRLCGQPLATDVPAKALEKERKLLEKHLSSTARSTLERLVRHYVREAKPGDVQRYREAAMLSGLRAGLLLSTDLVPLQKAMSGNLPKLSNAQFRELCVFLVSDELGELRTAVSS